MNQNIKIAEQVRRASIESGDYLMRSACDRLLVAIKNHQYYIGHLRDYTLIVDMWTFLEAEKP